MTLASLASAVQSALDARAIGTPSAARLLIYNTPDPDGVDRQLDAASRLASDWFGCPPVEIRALGSVASGERTALLRFADGQSALISSGVCSSPPYLTSAILLGTEGTIAWHSDERSDDSLPVSSSSSGTGLPADDTAEPRPAESRWTGSRTAVLASESARAPASTPPFGVLLVAGDHTHQPTYAAAFNNDPRCQLIGLTDGPDLPADRRLLNQQLANRLEIPWIEDLDAALRLPDVDLVSICAEPYRRGPIICRAAEAGKHLYLDKPLCGRSDEIAAIVQAVREANVATHMFSQVRWETARRARAVLESGRLGMLVAVHLDLCFAKGPGGTVETLRPRTESALPERFELPDAKRELTNVGVYGLVALLWLVGRDIRSISATTGNYFFRQHQQRDMEDFGQILCELEDGITASVTAGRTGWHSHPAGGLNRIHLVGTRGAATVDADWPRAEIWSGAGAWKAPQVNPADPMGMWPIDPDSPYVPAPKQDWFTSCRATAATDIEYFVDCIERGERSEVTIEIAAAASEALFAAYQSAATHTTVLMG